MISGRKVQAKGPYSWPRRQSLIDDDDYDDDDTSTEYRGHCADTTLNSYPTKTRVCI